MLCVLRSIKSKQTQTQTRDTKYEISLYIRIVHKHKALDASSASPASTFYC